MMLPVILIISYLCVLSLGLPDLNAKKLEGPSDLVLIHILYRHGDRSSIQSYPTDPYNESSWPQGFGQLSTVGMRQHYTVGQYLRKRYIEGQPYKLLKESYDRFQVHVRSTDFERTLMSAYCNLAGMFPPNGSQVWNDKLPWQPIPVHTVPKESDHLLNVGYGCPKYAAELHKVYESDWVQKMVQRNKAFYEYVANSSGVQNFSLINTFDLGDTLFCEKTHNLTLPPWVDKEFDGETTYNKLREIENISFSLEYNSTILSRLTGGPLLGEVVKNMKHKRDGKLDSRQKAFIYSAHDSTVLAFLSALKVSDYLEPPYAATVLVELFNTSGQLHVEVWYRNSSVPDAQLFQMTIPGCNASCPLDKFIELTKANIPTDWHAECQNHLPSHIWLITVTVIGALLVVLIVVILIVEVVRRRRQNYRRYGRLPTK